MRHLSFKTWLYVIIMLCPAYLLAQTGTIATGKGTKYMFCIGINNYMESPNAKRDIKNLHGCLNDVDTISRLFVKYYDFNPDNITLLKDQQASRGAIFQTFTQLLAKCRKGDYLVFFYSGHGSCEWEEKKDNQTKTGKGYRNTIVPADVLQPGIFDINSVELNHVFSGFTKKGVVLTIITDCCHSATNTRGSTLFEVDSAREVQPSTEIRPAMLPGQQITTMLDQFAVLSIGACQDNQLSLETQAMPGKFFGAFTISLCRSVTEWSQAPVAVLLDRTIARLRMLNKTQTPNMEGSKRLTMNLVGTAHAQVRKMSYTLSCMNCSANKLPVLRAGFADDLYNDDILVDMQSKDSIRVSNVGLSETEIAIINQNKKLKAADLTALHFSVLKQVANPDPPLKIFLGNSVAPEVFEKLKQEAVTLLQQKNTGYTWTNPSLTKIPEAVVFYQGGWKLNRDRVRETTALPDLHAGRLKGLLEFAQIKNAYLQLPPSILLTQQLTATLTAARNRNIKIVATPDAADYILAGHLENNASKITYGWEKAIQGDGNDDIKKASLPVVTDFFPVLLNDNYPLDSLALRVNRLSVLANWLSMKSPPPDKSLVYPYHLAIKNLQTSQKGDDKIIGRSTTTDKLDIMIEKDAGSKIKTEHVPQLFIYVMSMDPKGNTYLLYPQPRTGMLTYPNEMIYDTSFYHLATVRHTTPGIYHYFFIALREPVSSRNVFTRRGVVRGEEPAFSDNPLEALLNDTGTGQRGDIKSFDRWLLKTVDIVTMDNPAK